MFVGADGWEGLNAEALTAMEGAHCTTHYSPENPSPAVRGFSKRYRGRYGREPSGVAALGYDAASLLGDALGRSTAPIPSAIRDAIAATTSFPGVTGSITIDAERNARKPVVVVQIRGGAFRFHSVVTPAP